MTSCKNQLKLNTELDMSKISKHRNGPVEERIDFNEIHKIR